MRPSEAVGDDATESGSVLAESRRCAPGPIAFLSRNHDACFIRDLPEGAWTTKSFSADGGMNLLRRVKRSTTLEFCRHEKTRWGTINDRRFFALVIAKYRSRRSSSVSVKVLAFDEGMQPSTAF